MGKSVTGLKEPGSGALRWLVVDGRSAPESDPERKRKLRQNSQNQVQEAAQKRQRRQDIWKLRKLRADTRNAVA